MIDRRRVSLSFTKLFLTIPTIALTACTGNGGSSSYDGEAYMGGGTNNTSAEEIISLVNSGDIQAVVSLVSQTTGGSSSEPESQKLSFSAESLGLAMMSGGNFTVKITMTVNGVKTVYSSAADSSGNYNFDIPPVPTGSNITVRMDIIDSDSGTLVKTGRTAKTATGDSTNLAVTLSSNFFIPLTPPAGIDAWVWLVNEDPSDPTGWICDSGDNSEYSVNVNKDGSTVQLGGLAIKDGVVYEMPVQEIIVGSTDEVTFTMNTAKNFPGCGKLKKTTSGAAGAPYDRIVYETTDISKKPALLDRADADGVFEVAPYAPEGNTNKIFQYSNDGVSWGNTYQYPDPSDSGNIWKASMNGVISTGWKIKMHYAVKIYGTVVAEGDVINTAD
ncbi:MAG: hypothetical protein IJU95_08980 [Treponema sp.]|nr:hypothetical protein [Treponema sp.]